MNEYTVELLLPQAQPHPRMSNLETYTYTHTRTTKNERELCLERVENSVNIGST